MMLTLPSDFTSESSAVAFDVMFTRKLLAEEHLNSSVVDHVLPEMLHLVDDHWYKYPPMNPIWHNILMVFIMFIGMLSAFGNGIVVYIFTTTKALRTPSNLLIVNLAFSDFCMMSTNSPTMAISCYYTTWIFGPLGCSLYGMGGSLFGNTSIWTMVMIAFDRYVVIVKGLSAKPMTIKSTLFRILCIWLQGLLWTVLPMLGWNRYVPEGNMTACGTDYLTKSWLSKSYIVAYSIFVYFSPLFVIIYSYTFIIKTVAAHERNMKEQAKKMNVSSLRSTTDGKSNMSAEVKLAKVAMTTISLWFLAWTPYLVINYSGIFELLEVTPLFTIWGSVFAKTNAVINPIVYAISHPKFRLALKTKLPMLVFGSVEPDTANTDGGGSVGTNAG